MSQIKILDCTLRDGGYCNQWSFGYENIKRISSSLVEANIDIVECGFLTEKVKYSRPVTRYNKSEEISEFIPKNKDNKMFVAMMNSGEYDLKHLPQNEYKSIDGIRLAFHKKNLYRAINEAKAIKDKGYHLFIQAMVSLNYTDEEFLDLIRRCNELSPYAFYIVDSFGAMKRQDLLRFFYLVENNLKHEIAIGFHSHNNLQLAYSNAQTLVDIRSHHDMIIDCSVYGMGRGAGNLNTELFVQYLNENNDPKYNVNPLLSIIDDVLDDFYQKNYWGYSLPNYLSASHNTHPNYASYLSDKHSLTVKEMNDIFDIMDDEKRVEYDKDYIENLYVRYQSTGQAQEGRRNELSGLLDGKEVLLIAPGPTSISNAKEIRTCAEKEKLIVISINFDYKLLSTDYIFISNVRRFKQLTKEAKPKCIVTSNIPADMIYYQTDYKELLNTHDMVKDNAGLMAIKFLMNFGVKKIYIAGMDGYSHDVTKNYGDSKMTFYTKKALLDGMNEGMSEVLFTYAKDVDIRFITIPDHINLNIPEKKDDKW